MSLKALIALWHAARQDNIRALQVHCIRQSCFSLMHRIDGILLPICGQKETCKHEEYLTKSICHDDVKHYRDYAHVSVSQGFNKAAQFLQPALRHRLQMILTAICVFEDMEMVSHLCKSRHLGHSKQMKSASSVTNVFWLLYRWYRIGKSRISVLKPL